MSTPQSPPAADPLTLSEAKAQRWRAIGFYHDGREVLLCLGASFFKVKEGLPVSFYDQLTDDERKSIRKITAQKFVGAPARGRWNSYQDLTIPPSARAAAA